MKKRTLAKLQITKTSNVVLSRYNAKHRLTNLWQRVLFSNKRQNSLKLLRYKYLHISNINSNIMFRKPETCPWQVKNVHYCNLKVRY